MKTADPGHSKNLLDSVFCDFSKIFADSKLLGPRHGYTTSRSSVSTESNAA